MGEEEDTGSAAVMATVDGKSDFPAKRLIFRTDGFIHTLSDTKMANSPRDRILFVVLMSQLRGRSVLREESFSNINLYYNHDFLNFQ